jgi:BirA family transcriptional regulator, biotin operon repressor / biotin---[acetyl-CoA-carboxylase] ligase
MNVGVILAGQRCAVNDAARTAVARVFRRKPLRYLALSDLARESKLPADAVVCVIEELKADGVRIGSRPPADYFYEPCEDVLHPDFIASLLQTRWWGNRLLTGDELTSTIDIGKAVLGSGNPHGTVAIANRQTKGRGRQGNAWVSPKGKDLLLTFIIDSGEWQPSPSLLSLYTATAAARVLDTAYGVPIEIKWPNDLMCGGRKLGGVLVERDLQYGVILASIGLNVHSKLSDWPEAMRDQSVSLSMLTEEELHRDLLIAQCGTTWEALWESMMADRGETVRGYWKQYSSTLGRRIRLYYRGQLMTGAALDIDEVGRLIFRSDDGSTLALLAEEVQQLRMEE